MKKEAVRKKRFNASLDRGDRALQELKKNLKKNPEKLLKKADETVRHFTKKGNSRQLFESLYTRGSLKMRAGSYKSALDDFRKARDISDSLNMKVSEASCSNLMGNAYLYMSMPEKALECYFSALKLYEVLRKKSVQSVIYLNMGNIDWFEGDYERAEENYVKGAKLSRGKDKKNKSLCLIGIGNIRLAKGLTDQALKFYKKAAETVDQRDYTTIAMIANNIGETYRRKKQWDKSLENLYFSYNTLKKAKIALHRAETLCTIGDVFIETGEYSLALKYLKKSLAIAEKIKSLSLKKDVFYSLSLLHEKSGDAKSAVSFYKKHMEVKEKLYEKKKKDSLSEMEMRFEVEKNDSFLDILRQKNRELTFVNERLKETLEQLKVLNGLIPICAWCKRIRNDRGYWEKLEKYIEEHSLAKTVNILCPDCAEKKAKEKTR